MVSPETLYEQIARHYPDWMFVCEGDTKAIQYASQLWLDRLNTPSPQDLHLRDLIAPQDYDAVRARIRKVLKTQATIKLKHQILGDDITELETQFVPMGSSVLALSRDTSWMQQTREDERQQLARELHDGLSQTLFSATMIAETLPKIIEKNPEQTLNGLERLVKMSKGALAELRSLMVELRPAGLAELRLSTALSYLIDAYSIRTHADIDAHIASEKCQHPVDVKINTYRVAQECLNNIVKHARARHVKFEYQESMTHIYLYIEDDGKGFNIHQITASHLGLQFMQERASQIGATLQLQSEPDKGTRVSLEWTKSDS